MDRDPPGARPVPPADEREALRQRVDRLQTEIHQLRLFETLIHTAGEGAAIVDRQERFAFANPAACDIFGVGPGGLTGRTLREFLDDGQWEAIRAQTGQRQAGQSTTYELRIRRPDGEHRHLLVTATPWGEDGRYAGALGIFRDVTELKRREQERARLERSLVLAQKMDSIGRLAGGIAHDLNNLLSPIVGFTGFVLRRLPPDSRHREPLEQVAQAAERAQELTSRLLAFGRRQTLNTQPLSLNELVRGFLPMLRGLMRKNVRVELRLDDGVRTVRADPGSLQQVLMNLVVNAQDAMPQGGRITIETANERPPRGASAPSTDAPPITPDVVLRVTDTGEGMDEQTQARVFEPFFTTKKAGAGTGLGLATVYGIVRQHGGQIELRSAPHQGTTFSVYLPHVAERAAPVHTRVPSGEVARGWETILVVEDNDRVRELACTILRENGYVVYDAADAEQALDLYDYIMGPVHLLLTDVMMPGRTGPELYAYLAEHDPALKVLYTSGYPAHELAPQGILTERIPFLPKPYSEATLTQKVREVLGDQDTSGS